MAPVEDDAVSIARDGDMVVLTMTPQRAQLIAASIWLGEANHRGWLDDLSTVMEAAAEGSGVFGEEQTLSEARKVKLHLPLPRDQAPVVHDPDLDTLYSPDALAEALTLPTNASVADALRTVTADAAKEAMAAVAEAAATTARAAKSAKRVRAQATADAATAIAELVSQTAAAVQTQADHLAETTRSLGDADPETAAALARETDLSAVVVARAAADAAMQAATAAADAAMELELEVTATAIDVAAVADAAARRLAAHAEAAATVLEGAKDTIGGERREPAAGAGPSSD